MANSIFLRYLRSAQLVLSSFKRASAFVLRLALPIASLLLLLPHLLPPPLSSFLPPLPIFLYANLLILAIFLSSSSTSPLVSSTSCSHYSVSSSPSSNSSDFRPAPLAGVRRPCCWKLSAVRLCSHASSAPSPPTLAQSAATSTEREGAEMAVSTPHFEEMQQHKRVVLMKQHDLTHIARTDGLLTPSKADQRFDHAGAPLKTETADEAFTVLATQSDEQLPSFAEVEMQRLESLSDDDLNKRCSEFIEKSLAKMRKELQECPDQSTPITTVNAHIF